MNLIGNSLKFTTTGYVLITLKETYPTKDSKDLSPGKARIELSVIDTGKVCKPGVFDRKYTQVSCDYRGLARNS